MEKNYGSVTTLHALTRVAAEWPRARGCSAARPLAQKEDTERLAFALFRAAPRVLASSQSVCVFLTSRPPLRPLPARVGARKSLYCCKVVCSVCAVPGCARSPQVHGIWPFCSRCPGAAMARPGHGPAAADVNVSVHSAAPLEGGPDGGWCWRAGASVSPGRALCGEHSQTCVACLSARRRCGGHSAQRTSLHARVALMEWQHTVAGPQRCPSTHRQCVYNNVATRPRAWEGEASPTDRTAYPTCPPSCPLYPDPFHPHPRGRSVPALGLLAPLASTSHSP